MQFILMAGSLIPILCLRKFRGCTTTQKRNKLINVKKFASQMAALILEPLPAFLLQLHHVPGAILQSGS